MNGPLLSWIKNFLSVRTQTVALEDKYSDSYPVLSGVPQCIMLALLLFLLHINNISYKNDKQCHDCFIRNMTVLLECMGILCQLNKPE